MSVSIVTCVYGGHARFVPTWLHAIRKLDPEPHEIIVASDTPLNLPADVQSLAGSCPWEHPQAFYLNLAITAAQTEWVVIADVDDRLMPRALEGLDEVDADVWQMGYKRSDGERYVVPQMTAAEYLDEPGNPFVGSSAIRTEAFRDVGGFRDVAFQDWDLWRRLALDGAMFQSSGRTHFRYVTHDEARTETELTAEMRPYHLAAMLGLEGILA